MATTSRLLAVAATVLLVPALTGPVRLAPPAAPVPLAGTATAYPTGAGTDPTGPAGRADATPATLRTPPGDADDDGLTAAVEAQVGTDPANPDTDADGLRDGGDPDIVTAVVVRLPLAAFRAHSPAVRVLIRARLNRAERAYLDGRVISAAQELVALRTRMDGCPPVPDSGDWLVACASQTQVRALLDLVRRNHPSIWTDPALRPQVAALPGLGGGGPARPVAAVRAPDGTVEEYVADEVVLRPPSQAALTAFLQRYHATVLRTGTPRVLTGSAPEGLPATTGWYLVRIDPARSPTSDLAAGMDRAGLRGRWAFSSPAAQRLMALVARERDLAASANPVTRLTAGGCTVCEHPATTGNVDAARWWWMTEDDDPAKPGEQGLSTGVIHAWEYLRYKGFPPTKPFYPVWVAVVDAGFDLDPVTGAPVTGGPDYFYSGAKPPQLDEAEGDWTAGGPGSGFTNCSGASCWHGQLSFGACCANARNGYGTAGTSGGGTSGAEVHTLLIRVAADVYTIALGIYDAVYNNADIINTSIDFECGQTCRTFDNGNIVAAAVGTARNHGAIVVASAGNQQRDISGVDVYPCTLDGAICVGAVTQDGGAWRGTGQGSNYGTPLDIWAPTGIRSAITRGSAAEDTNDVDQDELALFGGTSCSAPYVSGVVALMRAVNPGLRTEQVRSILRDTANASTDARVSTGYVDAFRAVLAAAPNQPPAVSITAPTAGAALPYQQVHLGARITDPEAAGPWAAEFASTVRFSSDRDGVLCSATGIGPDLSCEAATLSRGTHVLTALATDPFGATATATRTVSVVNQPPTVIISNPPAGATFRTSQQVNLHAVVFDPDEVLGAGSLAWRSSIDGALGTGLDRWVTLSAGTHTLTATATDSQGATGSSSVQVQVVVGAGYPTATITWPADRSVVSYQVPTTLTGTATDPEDGTLTGAALRWSSDVDGFLGTGPSVTVTLSGARCTQVLHRITLTATDRDGHVGTHTIQVGVVSLC